MHKYVRASDIIHIVNEMEIGSPASSAGREEDGGVESIRLSRLRQTLPLHGFWAAVIIVQLGSMYTTSYDRRLVCIPANVRTERL